MNLNIKLEILLIYLIYKIKKQRMVLNRSSFVFFIFIINIIYGAVVVGAVKLTSIYSESVEQHVPDVHTLAINRTEFNMQ